MEKVQKIANKKIVIWGSKPLTYNCIKYLNKIIEDYNGARISSIVVSKKELDKKSLSLKKIIIFAIQNEVDILLGNAPGKIKGDIGICIGYPEKITLDQINNFKNGIINIHFAPLPYYRGSKTLSHAIINGEKRFGISLHYITEGIDEGPLIDVKFVDLPERKPAKEINRTLEKIAFKTFKKYINQIITKDYIPAISQSYFIKKDKIVPKFYTRKSLQNYYKVSKKWSHEKLFDVVRALSTDGKQMPYFEENGKKIYLIVK